MRGLIPFLALKAPTLFQMCQATKTVFWWCPFCCAWQLSKLWYPASVLAELPVTEGPGISVLGGEGRWRKGEEAARCRLSPEPLGGCARKLSVLADGAPGPCQGDLPSWKGRQPTLEEHIERQMHSCCVRAGVWCPQRGCSWEEIFLHGSLRDLRGAQKHRSCFNALLCPHAVWAWGKFWVQRYCRLWK